ncbi:hypothetical protein HYH03_003337 [Edaphochlamys debaryana]|uniref:Uncharacterized protein n=1 Tax=Edaphochlamys debaryana TaxID=47281 RepID=A0A835Y9P4_9CHLO|nr:hypothetical protein HYH03_003337 [Edaphochlamys debaryana]|eukprot:KAG2498586.1 hypothetical protein HYH03_003337 [Edaphochlamys debaryana]
MAQGPLASAYAGQAAQEEDTLGLPTYAQFKKYATFKTDAADFAVDMRALQRLLAECDYGLGAGGLGLGDLPILFASISKQSGALTFEGVLRLCRILRPRMAKVETCMAGTSDDARDPIKFRPSSAAAAVGAGRWAQRSAVARGGAAGSGGMGSGVSALDFQAVMDGGGENGAGPGSSRPMSGRPSLLDPSGAAGASASPRPGPAAGQRPLSAGPGRPASAGPGRPSLLDPSGTGNGLTSGMGMGGTHTGPAASGGPSTSGRSGGVPSGLGSLMALKDPPVLLREQLPPPPCAYPAIAARINGIQVQYRDGEMTRVALALRDLQRDWEAACSASALASTLRQGRGGGGGDAGGARGEIPLEGRIWLLLLHGCCLMLDGKARTARKSLQAAESLFNPNILGLEHPYHYCIHLCFGLLGYYEQQYEEAIEKFESARELADLVSRGSFDVTARRNAAACLNNKGVCHALLGNRADAVLSFRSAYALVRAAEGVPEGPEAVVALRNLSKALKQGFALNTTRLRPTSAPPMYAHVGSTAIPREHKLQAFLGAAITMRAPPPIASVPARCTKLTPEDIIARKKAKEAAKKAKAKAAANPKKGENKAKKPPPFVEMVNYPAATYGIANQKVEAAKKKGKKKAAG